ncbi:MAG TPA: S1 RNA-binding domain-containing protein, partial [Anaerolineales bacterium]|nr:S1 RNA-binding domain-containing protein [Anaerolineales bacterium]
LKREGIVPAEDLRRLGNGVNTPRIDDEVEVMVVSPLDPEGDLIVSLSQAHDSGDWARAEQLLESGEVFEGTAAAANRGGLVVPFGKLRGFVPVSQLAEAPRGVDDVERVRALERRVGRSLPLRVIEVDPQRRRLVLSERKAVRAWRQERKAQVIESLKEGDVRKGVVTSVRDFGAFVDIGGADGLIHISELSWSHVLNPADVVHEGQEVEAMVVRLDRESNRISLSLKRLQPSPWLAAAGQLAVGQTLAATVVRFDRGELVVAVEPGVEGRLPWMSDRSSAGEAGEGTGTEPPSAGTRLRARVVSFEPERERLGLALEQGQPEPMN